MANPVGRPKIKIDYEKVEKLASYGLTQKEIADFLGIAGKTLDNRIASDEEFVRALKEGKIKADSRVAESLYNRAIGYSHPEEKIFCHDGQIVRTETIKHYPPDPTSMIYWLKNRRTDLWRDKTEVDHGLQDPLLEKYKDMSNDDLVRAAKKLALEIVGDQKDGGNEAEAKSA